MYKRNTINEIDSNPLTKSLHYSYKKFSSMRAFVNVGEKTKYCISCGNKATQEAVFAEMELLL
jgi:hypothetical protein